MKSQNKPIEAPWIQQHLSLALQRPLPGKAAQFQMASAPCKYTEYKMRPNPRKAAVLALFFNHRQNVHLLFTQRALTLKHHKGQICFPGGRYEESDQNFTTTALRESAEELGLPPQDIQILGRLSPLYIPSSHNLVYPIVGWLRTLPKLTPNAAEVSKVIFAPLQALLNPANSNHYSYQKGPASAMAPCYRVNGTCIWGATAMITSELLSIIRNTL